MTTNHSLLLRLQDALIEATKPSRESIEAGGFVVMLTPNDPLVWINYAVPISPKALHGVDAMVEVFRTANRIPRLEFFFDLWPDVAHALEAKRFVCEKRMPIMVLRREEWQSLSHDHRIEDVSSETYRHLNQALSQAFGVESNADETPVDLADDPNFQRLSDGTTFGAVALADGSVVGGGYAVGTRQIREIAGIGTLAAYRKRGIASAVIAHLLDRFFGNGGEIAWLTPGDDTAQSVYTNLGFKAIAEQVCYELPAKAFSTYFGS